MVPDQIKHEAGAVTGVIHGVGAADGFSHLKATVSGRTKRGRRRCRRSTDLWPEISQQPASWYQVAARHLPGRCCCRARRHPQARADRVKAAGRAGAIAPVAP